MPIDPETKEVLAILAMLFFIFKFQRFLMQKDSPSDVARVETTPFAELSEPIQQAIQEGRKIQAIKHLRTETGCSLKEGKQVIDAAMAEIAES